MRKKLINILSFVTVFVLFGISIYCIFDGASVSAKEKEEIVKEKKTVYVDIKGAINNPGVYEMDYDSRIIDVIKEAGDLTEEADTSILNLSKKVEDEMYIIIYTKEEMSIYKEKLIPNKTIIKEIEKKIVCPDEDNDACLINNSSGIDGKININTASKEELESLPGVGSSKAESIIEYRNSNIFNSIEDIKNVNGIGDSLYEKIKDNIEV
jgi:competence protein ComEA